MLFYNFRKNRLKKAIKIGQKIQLKGVEYNKNNCWNGVIGRVEGFIYNKVILRTTNSGLLHKKNELHYFTLAPDYWKFNILKDKWNEADNI